MTERKIVVPGEVVAKGDYLPGEWTEKRGEEIVSIRYGLAEEANRLVKVIPLSGVYIPRRGNVIIGKVEKALEFYTPEQIFLNTDCGFGCFAERCVNDEKNAFEKIKRMVEAAEILRKRYNC